MSEQNRNLTVKEILSKKPSTLQIRATPSGTLRLRTLTLNDLSFLEGLGDLGIPAEEFVAQILHHQIDSPDIDLEGLRTWPTRILIRAVCRWVQHPDALGYTLQPSERTFEGLQGVINQLVDERRKEAQQRMIAVLGPTIDTMRSMSLATWTSAGLSAQPTLTLDNFTDIARKIAGIGDSLQLMVRQFTKPLIEAVEAMQAVSNSLQIMITENITKFQAGALFSKLPDLGRWVQQWEEIRDAADALDENGYGFATHLLNVSFVRTLVDINPRIRGATMTRQLHRLTCKEDFAEDLQNRFLSSAVLRRRWKIVAASLGAHQARNYALSIPVLLTQLEGVLGDMLILNGLAMPKGAKLFAKDESGGIKRSRSNKEIELRGIAHLVQHSKFQDHPVLRTTTEHMASRVVPDRNAILHGRNLTFDRAKLSTQLVLLLDILATEFILFETGEFVPYSEWS